MVGFNRTERRWVGREGGFHTSLEPDDVVIAYEIADKLGINPKNGEPVGVFLMRYDQAYFEGIAAAVNANRESNPIRGAVTIEDEKIISRHRYSTDSLAPVTGDQIRSLLRQRYQNSLTKEDFTD